MTDDIPKSVPRNITEIRENLNPALVITRDLIAGIENGDGLDQAIGSVVIAILRIEAELRAL